MTGQWSWKIKNKKNTHEEEKTERKQTGFPTNVGNLNKQEQLYHKEIENKFKNKNWTTIFI